MASSGHRKVTKSTLNAHTYAHVRESDERERDMRHHKYKREHFGSQEEYDHFKSVRTKAMRRWYSKRDEDPDFKERRILRQRLYSRYYWQGNVRQSFHDRLAEHYAIEDIKTIPLERLRVVAAVIPGPYGIAKSKHDVV